MINVFLTQYDGKIIGPVAKLLGYLMDGIFVCLEKIGIPNIGLAIILFTLIIYLLLTPLTIKQQKFSKLSAKMNPELQAIQAKYKNKKDQESMTRMNEETKAVYAKYGVSPSGSCVQLLIQMPILFALYRVIYNFPAYVPRVKELFIPFVSKFIDTPGAIDFIQNKDNFKAATQFAKQFSNELFMSGDKEYVTNTFIDVLNRASTSEWSNIYASGHFENFKDLITNAQGTGAFDLLHRYNNFLGMNIGDSPSYMVTQAFTNKQFGLLIAGILVPLLAAATQWINTKLMPQQENQNDQANAMAASMKTMNVTMPIMSAIFCFTLPAGMGIYWIAGAVIRSIQQVIINKKLDKIDVDALVEKNKEKVAKKIEKAGVSASTLSNNAKLSTKALSAGSAKSKEDNEEAVRKATEYYNKGAKPGSLAAKANMVKAYNEKNNQ